MSKRAGRFITLEGGEGVGKSTQALRIADALRARDVTVIVTREPGGTIGAEAIRTLLLTGTVDRWSARAEALLFAAARVDHVERVIAPALARGDWVICDRYLDSTRAYQAQGGVSDAELLALHALGAQLMPDRTVLFQLALDTAHTRVRTRNPGDPDRFEARTIDTHLAVSSRFDTIAAAEPARVRVVDASGTSEQVTAAALAQLADLL